MVGNDDPGLVRIAAWSSIPWLRHGFSTRRGGVSTVYLGHERPEGEDGDLNTGWTASDIPENVAENRRRLVEMVGGDRFSADSLITVRQVHSAQSLIVPASTCGFFTAEGRAALEADGLMTNVPGSLLGVQTADCVPVLVVDIEQRVVAAFHAGWRGTVARIVEQGIERMHQEYGSLPKNLLAAVGPSIGPCCYSVREEVREAFAKNFAYAEEIFDVRGTGLPTDPELRTYLNLWEANRRQLLGAGIPAGNISAVGECSGCTGLPGRRKYFSHRCENGFTGRMMSVVGVV